MRTPLVMSHPLTKFLKNDFGRRKEAKQAKHFDCFTPSRLVSQKVFDCFASFRLAKEL